MFMNKDESGYYWDEFDDNNPKYTKTPYTILTVDKFNEHNAVFLNNKKVADNPEYPLCAENNTYQNEVRELFYQLIYSKENVERLNNINTSLGCGLFHNDISDKFIETLFNDGWAMTDYIKDICQEFSSEATEIVLEQSGVIDKVYPREVA
jgi:hypothetical protein